MSDKKKDPNEHVADLAEAIVRVADAGEKLLDSGLGERALIVLVQDHIGSSYVTRLQIRKVLRALPELKRYLK